jgi:hypothetical protein
MTTTRRPLHHYRWLRHRAVRHARMAGALITALVLVFVTGPATTATTAQVGPDTDGDGLLDVWEQKGYTARNGQFVDLPAMGASASTRDLFVHIDWMAGLRPTERALRIVHNAFARQGINLHLDNGPDSIRNFTLDPADPAARWGNLSRAAARPFSPNLSVVDADGNQNWAPFDWYRGAFVSTGRDELPFRYALFANAYDDTGRSGIAWGRDLIVSLGTWDPWDKSERRSLRCVRGTRTMQQAGTFMHELGHTLNLRHGGSDDINHKPNYLSVMSYSFQMSGLYRFNRETRTLRCGNFDYSGAVLDRLDEMHLNERVGLSAASAGFGTRYYCPARVHPRGRLDANANGPIDWNCDGRARDRDTRVSVNRDAAIGVLAGFDDWRSISVPGTARSGGGAAQGPDDAHDPFTKDLLDEFETGPVTMAFVSPEPNAAGWNRTDVTVTLKATDGGDVTPEALDEPPEAEASQIKGITYSSSGAQSIPTVTVAGDTLDVDITAAGETELNFSATDVEGAVEPTRTLLVQVDKTPPSVTCAVTPTALWPPNHKMVPVTVSVTVTDSLSGSAGFTLVSVTSDEGDEGDDIQGFVVGTADTAGQLRSERLGSGDGRTYTLTYEGSDVAGNTSRCSTTVTVPHDLGRR